MTNIILTDPNADIIIIDPEREYSPLVRGHSHLGNERKPYQRYGYELRLR